MNINLDLWEKFDLIDPFNKIPVKGYMCPSHGIYYGSLLITHVDGHDCEQLIYGTPKIGYPFDKVGRWIWPSAIRIERYLKFDGSNICAYSYKNSHGEEFVTYKLRQRPFLANGRFGAFLDMWKFILKKYPGISKLPYVLKKNIAFELWGYQNKHLIEYKEPLETTLIFARDSEGNIYPPSALNLVATINNVLIDTVTKDYVFNYENTQKEIDAKLKSVADNHYIGDEGEVWYILTKNNKWSMVKLKPETIEKIHWSAGGFSSNSIRTTCLNALEQWDYPTLEDVKQLLLEEFSKVELEIHNNLITKIYQEIMEEQKLKESVIALYRKIDMPINLGWKVACMREMSKHFDTKQMEKVFSIIKQYEEIKNA